MMRVHPVHTANPTNTFTATIHVDWMQGCYALEDLNQYKPCVPEIDLDRLTAFPQNRMV
jgi:hypothetical protein